MGVRFLRFAVKTSAVWISAVLALVFFPACNADSGALAYVGFAVATTSILLLAILFVAAGIGIGCVETAEHAVVASLTPENLRGSAFGLLAAVQSFGNLIASSVAGVLWTIVSPTAAFGYSAVSMFVALALLALLPAGRAVERTC